MSESERLCYIRNGLELPGPDPEQFLFLWDDSAGETRQAWAPMVADENYPPLPRPGWWKWDEEHPLVRMFEIT